MGRIDVTYEEHARLKYRRYRGLDQFKVIGWVLLNCCLLSITVGIVILVIGRDVNNFPIPSGSPIWSGIMVIFACVFAFVVGCYNPHFFHAKDSTKLFTWVYVYIVMAVIALILCIISLGLTIQGVVVCGRNRGNTGQLLLNCGYNYDVQLVMNVAATLLCIFEIIFMIYGIVLYFIYKDAFQFYEWENAYYDEYYYTVPRGEHRYVERYLTSDTDPVVTGEVDYVNTASEYVNATSEKPRFEVVEGSVYSGNKSDMKGANVVSEYNTSNHRYLVLRFDRNQVRPIN